MATTPPPVQDRRSVPARLVERVGAVVAATTAVVVLISGAIALLFAIFPELRPHPPPERLSATLSKVVVEPGVSFGDYLERVGAADEYRRLKREILESLSLEELRDTATRSGSAVASLQRLLLQQGVYDGPVDGISSPATLEAVKRFQVQSHEIADGDVGPRTLRALVRANPTSFARPGLVVFVQVKVDGFRVRQFAPLKAQLYDSASGMRVRDRAEVPVVELLRPLLPRNKALALTRLGEVITSQSRVRPEAPIDQRGKLLWIPAPRTKSRLVARVQLYDLGGELVDFADSRPFLIVRRDSTRSCADRGRPRPASGSSRRRVAC